MRFFHKFAFFYFLSLPFDFYDSIYKIQYKSVSLKIKYYIKAKFKDGNNVANVSSCYKNESKKYLNGNVT